jgi:2-C-methyl-D-erythritol 4-phosphate cytidylyltransferase
MTTAALVVAAGRGERLRTDLPKAFVSLAGRALVVHALEAVGACPEVDAVIPVVAPEDFERFAALRSELANIAKLLPHVAGGERRQDSVRAGLAAVPPEAELVAVHDAARPLVTPGDVARVIAAARRTGAALLAAPVGDTIKRVREGRVVETPAREECWTAQTPQAFRVELLREALAKAEAEGFHATDDAQLVERLGVEVQVVEGNPRHLKVTWPGDLAVAEEWLRARQQRARG